MRKIIFEKSLDLTTFEPRIKIVEKNEDGEILTIFDGIVSEPKSKYTPDQQKKINECNRILELEGHSKLTEEEIEFMLDPSGMMKRLTELDNEMKNTENLQKLAGFKVEKVIVPLT